MLTTKDAMKTILLHLFNALFKYVNFMTEVTGAVLVSKAAWIHTLIYPILHRRKTSLRLARTNTNILPFTLPQRKYLKEFEPDYC